MKYLYWLPPYLGVYIGLYILRSAWAALIGFHIGILLVLWITKPKISLSILFKSKNIKWVVSNLLLCGSSGLGIYLLQDVFGLAGNLSTQLSELGLNQVTWIPFIAYFSLVNPFVEEYFWRGVFGSETKNLDFGDFAYAGYHGLVLFGKVNLFAVIFSIVCLSFVGWFWRQVKRENEGLFAPVLGHISADFSILITVYFMTR